jgi:hypothetical protein
MPVRARAVAWRVLVLAVGARAVVRPLRWVHIPKCGQSWAVTMFDYWCAPADADAAAAFLEASRSPTRVVEAERRFGARCAAGGRLVAPVGGHAGVRPSDVGRVAVLLRAVSKTKYS